MHRTLGLTISLCLLGLGCQSIPPRLNAPPQGPAVERPHDMQGPFTYMTDNALLADMSISDRHFLPHRPKLTTMGEQRVRRLAQLIEAYGGTIRYSTDLADDELAKGRESTVMAYLSELGMDTSGTVLVRDMRGGSGMDAAEALLIKENEGTYKPKASAQVSPGAAPTGGGDEQP